MPRRSQRRSPVGFGLVGIAAVAAMAITIDAQAPQPAAPKKVTVIKAARLIDGQGAPRSPIRWSSSKTTASRGSARGFRSRRAQRSSTLATPRCCRADRLPHPRHRPARRELLRGHVPPSRHRRRGGRPRLRAAHAATPASRPCATSARASSSTSPCATPSTAARWPARACRPPALAIERHRRPRRPDRLLALPALRGDHQHRRRRRRDPQAGPHRGQVRRRRHQGHRRPRACSRRKSRSARRSSRRRR